VRTRVGLAVGTASVRAVAARGDAIVWTLEAERVEGEALAPALLEFLRNSPVADGWPRPRVTAVLSPGLAQVKRLSGLPTTADAALLADVLREAPGRFFLKRGASLATGGVRPEEPGSAWGAAYDGPTVSAVAEACRSSRVRLGAVLPAVALLGRATAAERCVWMEDGCATEVLFDSTRRLCAVRRLSPTDLARGEDVREKDGHPVRALAELGVGAWRFADAYSAAVWDGEEPLAHWPNRTRAAERSIVPRWRIALAGAVAATAGLAALGAPGLSAMRARDQAAAELRSLARARGTAVAAERDISVATAALAELARFNAADRPVSSFLAAVARSLPEESAIVAIRLDSAGGQLVALAPSAAVVVRALERVPEVGASDIAGPVTRERVAGPVGTPMAPLPPTAAQGAASSVAPLAAIPVMRADGVGAGPPSELERVTVRFRFRALGAPPRALPTGGGTDNASNRTVVR
jgi:hypothetical protein